ncbi:MAG: TrkA family potassium uptake protein [Caldiserica bacterium]|nr:MAG: TrkA family potassium uptake protein [Caldisericota bacterium]
MMKKTFGVIGLGRFGLSVAINIEKRGFPVLGIDNNREIIERVKDKLTHVVQADASDPQALEDAGIKNCDTVIIAIGDNKEQSILATMLVKDFGIKYVVSKAVDELHGRILEKIGADLVVFPEKERGETLAIQLTSTSLIDYIEISPEYDLEEAIIPQRFVGKTIRDLDLGRKYKVIILAIRRNGDIIIAPSSEEKFQAGDIIVFVGRTKDISKFTKDFLE